MMVVMQVAVLIKKVVVVVGLNPVSQSAISGHCWTSSVVAATLEGGGGWGGWTGSRGGKFGHYFL